MDIDAARAELSASMRDGPPFHAAHGILLRRGIEALGIAPRPGIGLDDMIRIAADAQPSEPRRAFAVLLVHALGVPGLLPTRGRLAADIQVFLERALLNPLRRAGYRFDGTPYEKREHLARLHATIEEHLQSPQPSIPHWIHGIGPREET